MAPVSLPTTTRSEGVWQAEHQSQEAFVATSKSRIPSLLYKVAFLSDPVRTYKIFLCVRLCRDAVGCACDYHVVGLVSLRPRQRNRAWIEFKMLL